MRAVPSAAHLQALVANNPTFAGFGSDQIETLRTLVTEVRQIAAGAYLVHEGELAEEIFIIEAGRLEVMKKEEDGDRLHSLAVLGPGMSVGEIALLDLGQRSASVRAIERSRVLVIPVRDLVRQSSPHLPIDAQMKIALGYELARRLRTSNELLVRYLCEKLRETELRAEMGRLMSRLLIGTTLYMYALGVTAWLKPYLPDTTPISIVILIAFVTSLIINIKTSTFPFSAYGLTTRNWQAAVKEALLFLPPVALLIELGKWIMIHSVPGMAGLPLFGVAHPLSVSGPVAVLLAGGYALFVPVQEFVARSVQSALMLYLQGRFRILLAVLISTMLFSTTHLHVSPILALEVFPLGLFWAWLYLRNPTLIGVCLSHVLLGLFAFQIVGVPQ